MHQLRYIKTIFRIVIAIGSNPCYNIPRHKFQLYLYHQVVSSHRAVFGIAQPCKKENLENEGILVTAKVLVYEIPNLSTKKTQERHNIFIIEG